MEPNTINIYLEANPNPNSLKFVADRMLVEPGRNYDFPDKESTMHAPLAEELFGYDYVRRVFYMSNFVTVTKSDDVAWAEIQDELKDHIKTFLESGKEMLLASAQEEQVEETEMDVKIKGLLEEYIKPAVIVWWPHIKLSQKQLNQYTYIPSTVPTPFIIISHYEN